MTFPSLHSVALFVTEEPSTASAAEGKVCYVGSLWAHYLTAPRGPSLIQKRGRRCKRWGCSAFKGGDF